MALPHGSRLRLTARRGLLISVAVLVVAAGVAVYLAATQPRPLLQPNDPTVIQRGAAVYAQACANCHGTNLEGQPNWQVRRPDGLLPAPPHDATGHTWHHPEHVLFDVTRNGLQKLAGPNYKTAMPAFADKLSDNDIIAVLSFIKSTWPPKQRQANDAASKTGNLMPAQ